MRWLHEAISELEGVKTLSNYRSFWTVINNDHCNFCTDVWYMPHPLPGVLDPLAILHNHPKRSTRHVNTRLQFPQLPSFKKICDDLYSFENLPVFRHPFLE